MAVIAGVLVAFVANLALFMIAFKLLHRGRCLLARTAASACFVAVVFWQLLQHLGGFYVDHVLKRTGPLYGVFALVLGLLAWLYLGAQLTIFAAEINVVRVRRLWPRSFFSRRPARDADRACADALDARSRGARSAARTSSVTRQTSRHS